MGNSFSQVAVRQLKLALVLACLLASQAQNSQLRGQQQQQGCGNGVLVCQVFESPEKELGTLESGSLYECVQGDMSYDLHLPQPFIDANYNLLDDGSTFVSIPGGCIVNGTTVEYPSNTTITVLPEQQDRRRRHLMTTEGNKTLLVVYVQERRDRWFPYSFVISDYLFGNRPESFVNQMHNCSQGKVQFQMAEGEGIVNGVYTVEIDVDPTGVYRRDIERLHVLPKMDAVGGESAYDHVMYCLPQGTVDRTGNNRWGAYALLHHRRSIYNQDHCGKLSAAAHEVGHNMGLNHANEYGAIYGDKTSYMGSSERQVRYPQQCYNAQNHYQLGWFDEQSLDLTESIRNSAWGGRMLPFVDTQLATDLDVVVIRVGRLYAQFNRARDYNYDNREYRDSVVIVESYLQRNPQSDLKAGIGLVNDRPSTYAYPNFEGTGHALVFEVCDQVMDGPPDYVHLSIHLDDGIQSSMCNVALPVITLSPTSAPSDSVMPSSSPTVSLEPSSSPSDVPSASPSAAPTMDCTGMNQPGALVPIGGQSGSQSCDWIAQHRGWKQFLCRPGFDAFEKCQETCDSCNDQNTTVGDTCEDSRTFFQVNNVLGQRRCFQLKRFFGRQPQWKERLCAPNQPAYDHCPETCGKCMDSCEDQDVSFEINKRFGVQNCAWLANRPIWQAFLCKPGHDAYEYCNELCNTCP